MSSSAARLSPSPPAAGEVIAEASPAAAAAAPAAAPAPPAAKAKAMEPSSESVPSVPCKHAKLKAGRLAVTPRTVAFSATRGGALEVPLGEISRHQYTPESSSKHMARLALEGGAVEQFRFDTRELLLRAKELITAALVPPTIENGRVTTKKRKDKSASVSASSSAEEASHSLERKKRQRLEKEEEAAIRSKLITYNPLIEESHRKYCETGIVSERDFWEVHKDALALERAAIRGANSQWSLVEENTVSTDGKKIDMHLKKKDVSSLFFSFFFFFFFFFFFLFFFLVTFLFLFSTIAI